MEQKPSVGRIVHYVAYGTPGGEFPAGVCRAAIITEVYSGPDGTKPPQGVTVQLDPKQPGVCLSVGLCVLNPTGQFFNRGVPYHDGGETPGDRAKCVAPAQHGNPFRYCACGWMEAHPKPGTWHWPERV